MNKRLFLLVSMLSFIISPLAYSSPLTIINHTGKPLSFVIDHGASYFHGLPRDFSVGPGKTAEAHVQSSTSACTNNPFTDSPSTYISVNIRGQAINKTDAYWAVGDCGEHVTVDGFLSQGIAYNWQNGQDAQIIFYNPKNSSSH